MDKITIIASRTHEIDLVTQPLESNVNLELPDSAEMIANSKLPSELENLRIIAEAEKFHQEMMYKHPLEKLAANMIHNEKHPIIARELMESAITEVLWSNEDNSL